MASTLAPTAARTSATPWLRSLRLPSAVSLAAGLAALAWLLAASPPDAAEPAQLPASLPVPAGPAGDTTVPDAATALRGQVAADEEAPPSF